MTDTPARVLVVDDDLGLRDSMVALLEAYGLTVVGVAADGEAGAELAALTGPDVVLMDLRMPVLDGLGATARIRATGTPAQVVLLSAYDDPGLVERARVNGAYAHLVKGCRGTHIVDVVNAAASVARDLRKEANRV